MKLRFPKISADRSTLLLITALAFAALVPVVAVLWFMNVAMRNERLAVQEQMAEVYLNQLGAMQRQVRAFWSERQAALASAAGDTAAEKFAALVRAGRADAVVIFDVPGKPVYPRAATLEAPVEEKSEWAGARELEFQKKDYRAAAAVYAKIAETSREIHAKARALQAEATCWLKAGDKAAALARLEQITSDATLRSAISAQGTLIAPNAQLMMVKLLNSEVGMSLRGAREPGAPEQYDGHLGEVSLPARRQRTLDDLVARLNDYSDTKLPATQRRFLMHEVAELVGMSRDSSQQEAVPSGSGVKPDLHALLPTLAAEDLAADYLEANAPLPTDGRFQRAPLAKVWRVASSDRTLVALYREERLKTDVAKLLAAAAPPDVRVQLLAPDEPFAASKLVPPQEAGDFLPGWRLGLSFRHGDLLAEASARQMRFYLGTGFFVVVIIALLALLVARYVSAQMRLARLKNELVSTVSHELKTPLASMRALVETLSARRYRDDAQLHDYLNLIAKENQRLGQLIENFLTFSRLERGRQQYHFEPVAPEAILTAASEALREKFEATHCRFEQQTDAELPRVRGDAGALTTVMVNLLDNAWKYTDANKHIVARAYANCETVIFEVADNGIGLGASDTKKIFERFYQVDQSLTRQRGGCGLGLSIVQSIVREHGGTVEVESELGKGSVFRVRIPIADGDRRTLNAERSTPNVEA